MKCGGLNTHASRGSSPSKTVEPTYTVFPEIEYGRVYTAWRVERCSWWPPNEFETDFPERFDSRAGKTAVAGGDVDGQWKARYNIFIYAFLVRVNRVAWCRWPRGKRAYGEDKIAHKERIDHQRNLKVPP
jgi:hypothetical protein